jgi:hypothetical protein
MGELLRIDQVINRRIDAELAKAKAMYGPRHFHLVMLEGRRGDTIEDLDLLRALRYLNLTGARFGRILKRQEPEV